MEKWIRAVGRRIGCGLAVFGLVSLFGSTGLTASPAAPGPSPASNADPAAVANVPNVLRTNPAPAALPVTDGGGSKGSNGNPVTLGISTNGAGAGAVGSSSSSNSSSPGSSVSEELALRYSTEALRSYLRLQEQMHTALLAINQARVEASAEAQTNVHAMLGRLETLEHDLAEKRAEETRAARNSNRLMMAAAAGMFLVGVLAMVLTAVIQARGMNRLAEIALGLGPARGLHGLAGAASLPSPGSLALAGNDRLLIGVGVGGGMDSAGGNPGTESGRLQSMIQHLEGRIRDMEAVARPTLEEKNGADAPGAVGTAASSGSMGQSKASTQPSASGFAAAGSAGASPRAVTLAKAQTLLNLGQPQAALGAVEDALVREPNDAELHLRKGMALERLKRFEQAIEAYDRAIALDARCTQAYLSKGGVLNQQSRYQEALACYEEALEHRTRSA